MNLTHEQFKAAKKNKAFTPLNVWDTVKGHPWWAPTLLAQLVEPPTSGRSKMYRDIRVEHVHNHEFGRKFTPNEDVQVNNPKDHSGKGKIRLRPKI